MLQTLGDSNLCYPIWPDFLAMIPGPTSCPVNEAKTQTKTVGGGLVG